MIKTQNTVAIYRDGRVTRSPWHIKLRGQPTEENLRRMLERPIFGAVDRAVIFDSATNKVRATYLRTTIPTDDQTRLIERIGARPGVTAIVCTPQVNGDVDVLYRCLDESFNTTVKRHPTVKEMIYEYDRRS